MAEEENLDTLIATYRDNLEYKAKDSDLVVAIDAAISETKEVKEKMDKIGKRNKLYWEKGTEKDLSRLHPKKAKVTSNRIFTDIETAIPIITSEPPEPAITGKIQNIQREALEKGLEIAYEIKYKMQQRLQKLVRSWAWNRLGIFKYRWDKEKGFVTENVLAKKIGIDKRATEKENCEFIWEELEDSFEELMAKFPKKKKDIQNLLGSQHTKSKIKYIEFWGEKGKWVCWKLKDIILDKKKNPNYDHEDGENNLFESPQFPYIFLNVFNMGDETGIYDESSLIEQSAPLQEGVNQLEQQILDLNEGQKRVWVASAEATSKKEFQDLIDRTGDLGFYLDRKSPVGGVQQVQSGKPDASLYNNLTHLLGEIDNTIGMHSTTRGERAEQETATGRRLLLGSDYGRLDLIVRNMEQVMEEWYNAYLQMLKVYSDETEILSDGKVKIELRREQIPNNIQIMVKKGSTLPIDKRTKMANAVQLAQWDKIDPATLFEELGYANVPERVQALYQWLQLTGKIQMPAMPQGQPMAQGQEQGSPEVQQLQQILSNPAIQQASPEQQTRIIAQGRRILSQIKGGGQ